MSLLDSVVDGSQMMELLPLTSAELNTSAYSPDASLLNQHRPQPSKASVMEPPDPDRREADRQGSHTRIPRRR
jgi:hypothetical protein